MKRNKIKTQPRERERKVNKAPAAVDQQMTFWSLDVYYGRLYRQIHLLFKRSASAIRLSSPHQTVGGRALNDTKPNRRTEKTQRRDRGHKLTSVSVELDNKRRVTAVQHNETSDCLIPDNDRRFGFLVTTETSSSLCSPSLITWRKQTTSLGLVHRTLHFIGTVCSVVPMKLVL